MGFGPCPAPWGPLVLLLCFISPICLHRPLSVSEKPKLLHIHSLSWASPLLPALFLNTSPQGCFVLIRLNVTSSWRPLLTPDLRVEIVLGYSSFYPPIHYYIFFVALSTSPYCTAIGLFFVNSPASSAHLPDPCS